MSEHLVRGVEWRARATALLAPITDLVAVPAGRTPAYSDVVRIDGHVVRRAWECLGSADPEDEYVESAANARRRVGLAVLACMRDRPGLDPVSAFEEVVADRAAWFSDRLVGWLDGLGSGGRGALAAEACGYAVAVAGEVPPARMGDVRISRPSDWLEWTVPGRALRLRGRCDAMTPRRGARPPGRRLLVVVGTLAGAEAVAGHTALAYTLTTASLPDRVTVLAPAVGRAAFVVDDHLLGEALARAGAAAAAAMAARFGPPAATTPGPWCRRCARSGDGGGECAPGTAWTRSHPVRVGGLLPRPVPAVL